MESTPSSAGTRQCGGLVRSSRLYCVWSLSLRLFSIEYAAWSIQNHSYTWAWTRNRQQQRSNNSMVTPTTAASTTMHPTRTLSADRIDDTSLVWGVISDQRLESLLQETPHKEVWATIRYRMRWSIRFYYLILFCWSYQQQVLLCIGNLDWIRKMVTWHPKHLNGM